MFTGEPPPTQGDLHFRIFGIPVRVHPLFWLVALILGSRSKDAVSLLAWVVAVFLSILCHELGHAGVMRAYGFRPKIILYGMGGLTSYDSGRSYGSKGSGTLGQILIALAGPAAGFLMIGIVLAGLVLSGYARRIVLFPELGWMPVPILTNPRLTELLYDVFFVSYVWGFVNLLPIYPLDGGQVAREILQRFSGRTGVRLSLMLSIVVAGMMAIYGAVQWRDWFVALMFGFLAYSSYVTLQAYTYRDS